MGLAELDHVRHREMGEALFLKRTAEVVDACKVCGGSGRIVSETWDEEDNFPFISSRICGCRELVFRELALHDAGLPREFWAAESISPTFNKHAFEFLRKYASKLDTALEHGLGLLLTGKNGAGKSSSACLPLISAIRTGRSAAFVNFPDLVQGWRRSWKDIDLAQHLDERTHRDLVVLDEIGKEHIGADDTFVASKLDSLLRLRRGSMLPTVITTNLTVPELIMRYGESMGSLLADRYKVIKYKPGDFRLSMSKTWDALLDGEGEGVP